MDPQDTPNSKQSASGPFAYQTRLLQRTSSRSTTTSLSRNNSQSSILTTPTGSSTTAPIARRWTPSHRVTNSLDAVRGKWEERSREAAADDPSYYPTSSPAKETHRIAPLSPTSTLDTTDSPKPSNSRDPLSHAASPPTDQPKTPNYLKRRTLPVPIIASPLSPNTTGTTVEAGPAFSSNPNRIHLPSSDALFTSNIIDKPAPSHSLSKNLPSLPPSRYRRSNTVGSATSPSFSTPVSLETTSVVANSPVRDSSFSTSPPVRLRPLSAHGSFSPAKASYTPSSSEISISSSQRDPSPSKSSQPSSSVRSSSPTKTSNASSSAIVFGASPLVPRHLDPSPSQPLSRSPSSVMAPTPYRSSYMAGKKSSSYEGSLGIGRRKLGRHLPRIASGDGPDEPEPSDVALEKEGEVFTRREKREQRLRDMDVNADLNPIVTQKPLPAPGLDDVAGLPGRIQLKAPSTPSSPLPSATLIGGLWADKQRHLIQAYEYLCHVGEAQQWIEGCLGEELGFGVVEMEDGLRNGVVLAKLVRAFQGEASVKKIYEAPKLDFRHSDNINVFFNFVRHIGLPEGFIFELTDLYEKKNLPKVIYCVHALSHLLARRGRAERIGNLLGRLHFSDDQLQKTQKGLKDSGVAMPNFGNVGRELAIEINEDPEVEVETEDERRDRLLAENVGSIVALQARLHGFLLRKRYQALQARMRLADRHIFKLQTHCKGLLVRRRLVEERKAHKRLIPWTMSLQAAIKGHLARKRWRQYLTQLNASSGFIIKVQAQTRGIIQRRRFMRLKAALQKLSFSMTRLQAVARAHVIRHTRKEITKTFLNPDVDLSIIAFQACARGALARRQVSKKAALLKRLKPTFTVLQARCRGVLMRRRIRAQMAKIENVASVIVGVQAVARTYLAGKRLLYLIRGLRRATPMFIGLQARARANLTRQSHRTINKALAEVSTVTSVNSFQALARASLARNRHQEISKKLEVVMPDVLGLQSAGRGALVRRDFCAWRDHLRRNHPVATLLQAMLRGAMQRRAFRVKMDYYRANLQKVVKIQSLFRAKEMREQYRQLTLGKNVTVGTIKNFVHLLDDSEADFREEIKVERLRKRVVEQIRENQALENDVNDLDVKIALVVQNVKSFEELVKVRKKLGADNAAAHAARLSLLAKHGDPFSGSNTLDHETRRKRELYQQLFYLLQTRGEYLSRLFVQLTADSASEANRRFTERVVLTLFGYGQDLREDFLLLKLFQLAIREEVAASSSLEEFMKGHPVYISIALSYVRSKQATYLKDSLQAIIKAVVDSDDLDLEANPCVIHRARIDLEEMRSGVQSSRPKDVPFYEALEDPETRAVYIRHLQVLQWQTEAFLTAMRHSTKKMPYGMRYLVRETLLALKEKFPHLPDEAYAACLGRIVYYRYINPAIITPETFEIVGKTVDVAARKNLAQISKILTQIASGVEFGEDNPSYVPCNEFVRKASLDLSAWFVEVADVSDAETRFHAHEFLDATVQPKPIYISHNEIYTIHGLLSQYLDELAPIHDDPLRIILAELGGIPHLASEELKEARDTAVSIELTNRFALVRDPHAEEKTLWVQAKRGVLAILRVQPAQDLLAALMRPVNEDDEIAWEEILEAELENEMRQKPRREPSAIAADSAYRLEDIRSLKFAAVKALAISNLLELEKQGKITREDGFQGILNAIAGDVRSKHRKRLQRQQDTEAMNSALRQLQERKKYFEEQINSYHDYVEAAMNTMQRGKGKRRFVLPFTKQYFHLRDLQRSGQTPQFGSFLYTAKYLYEKGILLSIDQYSPRQFDKIQITMSSDSPGVFTLLMEKTVMGITSRMASEDIRMEDLLQAKYEKRSSISLLNNQVKVNFELFLFQINKKFYV